MMTNWVGWMLSIIVFLLLFLCGWILSNSVRLLITGERVQGVVVGMDASKSPGENNLLSPIVEFTISTGEKIRVNGHSYSVSPSAHIGDVVTVAYSQSNPKNTQIILLKEFPLGPAGFIFGFALFMLLIWISVILASGDSSLNDPLNILPTIITYFRLNPVRFPIFFILSIVIPLCGIGTYVLSKSAFDMRSNGIKVIGHVVGFESVTSNDNRITNGTFPTIAFDVSGKEYKIRGSTVKWLSGLKTGDSAEVIYLANHPDKGKLNKWSEIFFPSLAFGLFFIAFLSMFILILKGIIRL